MSNDDALWKRRFLLLTLIRFGGTALILVGLLVGFSDLITPGGNRLSGLLIMGMGLAELAVLPRLLRKGWRQP